MYNKIDYFYSIIVFTNKIICGIIRNNNLKQVCPILKEREQRKG